MFAVIKSGGRQYKVVVGETLYVNRLSVDVGDQIRFEEVLLISDADNTRLGTPLVDEALVLATAIKQGRGPKLIVFKYKPKKRYRHKRGHRQELTFLTIDDIIADGKSLVSGDAPRFRAKGVPAAEEVSEDATVQEQSDALQTPEETAEETPAVEPEKKSRRRRTVKAEEPEQAEE
jgi:large subunit ribosomal protein L21